MPIKKEGMRSTKENPFGLKAKYVTNLNTVKMARKIKKRLITHKMVLGILYFTSMIIWPVEKDYKRIEFIRL
jgi:hypothetical protein